MPLRDIITRIQALIAERDAEIIRLYTVEKSGVNGIASAAGMQTSSILRLLARHGIPRRNIKKSQEEQ